LVAQAEAAGRLEVAEPLLLDAWEELAEVTWEELAEELTELTWEELAEDTCEDEDGQPASVT